MTEVHHTGDGGQPCARHGAASLDAVFALAMLGARLTRFQHDIASKLQGVMLSLDEIAEHTAGARDPELARALETATSAAAELERLLAASRSVSRPPLPTRTTVRDLIARASERTGVALVGEPGDIDIECCAPLIAHALAIVIDVASGNDRVRTLAVTAHASATHVELAFATSPAQLDGAATLLAVAAWLLAQHGAELRCQGDTVIAKLPLSAGEYPRPVARR